MSDDLATLSARFNAVTAQPTLTGIVDAILSIVGESEDGELTAEACDLLDALNLSLEQKTQGYHIAYKRLNADASACKELAKAFTAKAQAHENRAERLREQLLSEMERLGTQRIKTPTVTAYTQETESVECESAETLPAEYVVTTISARPDKKRIAEELKAGANLPFARLVKSNHLRFR